MTRVNICIIICISKINLNQKLFRFYQCKSYTTDIKMFGKGAHIAGLQFPSVSMSMTHNSVWKCINQASSAEATFVLSTGTQGFLKTI